MNLPNKLTCLRVLLIPVFLIFLYIGAIPYHFLLALVVFAAASITDALDGKIARARGLVTNFGKFLDPLADKVLVITALLAFIGRNADFSDSSNDYRSKGIYGFRLADVDRQRGRCSCCWHLGQAENSVYYGDDCCHLNLLFADRRFQLCDSGSR